MRMKGREGVSREGFDCFAPGFEDVRNVLFVEDFVARDAAVEGREGALEHRAVDVARKGFLSTHARTFRRKAGRTRLTVGDAVQNSDESAFGAEEGDQVASEDPELFRAKELRIISALHRAQSVLHVGKGPLAASALRLEPLERVDDERHDALVRVERPGDLGDGLPIAGSLPDGRSKDRCFFAHKTSSAG